MVVDLGLLRNNRQTLVNTLDSGGARRRDPAARRRLRRRAAADGRTPSSSHTINANYPGLPSSAYTISYKCLIGVDTVSPAEAVHLARHPARLRPALLARAHPPVAADFIGSGPTRYSSCDPAVGDKCNAVVVAGRRDHAVHLRPRGRRQPGLDRRGRLGRLQRPVRGLPADPGRRRPGHRPHEQHERHGHDQRQGRRQLARRHLRPGPPVAGPRDPRAGRDVRRLRGRRSELDRDRERAGGPATLGPDRPERDGLLGSSTYANVTAAINCYPNSSTGTDLADPITMAAYELAHNGRAGVRKGIIFETDGQPNAAVAAGPNYCALSNAAATAAKAQNIEIFTIGFGLDAASGGDPACPDTSGTWKGKTATALLASMATSPIVGTTTCDATENNDGDHFYCIGKTGASTDLLEHLQGGRGAAGQGRVAPRPALSGPGRHRHQSRRRARTSAGPRSRSPGRTSPARRAVKFGGTRVVLHGHQRHLDHGDVAGRDGRQTVDITVTTPGGTTTVVAAAVHLQLTPDRSAAVVRPDEPDPSGPLQRPPDASSRHPRPALPTAAVRTRQYPTASRCAPGQRKGVPDGPNSTFGCACRGASCLVLPMAHEGLSSSTDHLGGASQV